MKESEKQQILTRHDQLHKLFKEDPASFEKARRQLLEEAISSARPENQDRLRAMQWNIDQQLSHYHDPTARLQKMIGLFYDGLFRFRDALEGKRPTPRESKVLLFKK